jgi:two-component system phosphate regulon sensor histidine kinase PhoR
MSDRASLFARGADSLRHEKKALLEHLEEGVMTVDSQGRVSYINKKALDLFGIQSDKILGKNTSQLSSSRFQELAEPSRKLVDKVLIDKERSYTLATIGEGIKEHFQIVAIPVEVVGSVILLIKDCSNQKKILEVGKEFIANASHELRTPVTIIRGFAETLKDLDEVSVGMYDSILEKIIRNCERMELLVKNLLTLADLENSGPLVLTPCNLIDILDEASEQILSLHPEVEIEQFINSEEVYVPGEETLLLQAFLNLMKNCVKYSRKPAYIKVQVEIRDLDVYVEIKDRGVGIPGESLKRVFDRFYTVDKTHSRRLGGAGIGLSIVKIILEKHGAKIWVTSQIDVGTTFHMSFSS